MRRIPCGPRRRGATVAELAVALGMLAVLLGIVVPAVRTWADRVAVRGAAEEVMALFASARLHAVARGSAAVLVDSARGRVLLRVRAETAAVRDVRERLGVRVSATRAEMAYDGRGLGRGASNLRVVLARGAVAETIFVSRLGRARR